MVNVVYDYQAFALQRYGGVSRYFAELIMRLRGEEKVAPHLPLRYADNAYLERILGIDVPSVWYRYRSHGARWLHTLSNRPNQQVALSTLSELDNPVFHPTYFDPYVLSAPECQVVPLVVTVHDMIHELFEDCILDPQTAMKKKRLVERADAIVVPSHATKNDLERRYPVSRGKVTVIPHGASLLGRAEKKELPQGRSRCVILYVGGRGGYKNFETLLNAFALLHAESNFDNNGVLLRCIGGSPFSADELRRFSQLGVADRIDRCVVSDEDLASEYAHATAFVLPSRYEGFGLPVLEAMTCGTPCVLSTTAALQEVGGDAALYFDPDDPKMLMKHLIRLLSDSACAQELSRKGSSRAEGFTWERSADQHAALYQSLR